MPSRSSSIDERNIFIHLARHLPPELVDLIASFVDSRRDLLAFASACRAFKQLIIPYHLDYRVVHCHLDRQSAWSHLVERPDLTRHVRDVYVYDLRSTLQPLPDRVPAAGSREAVNDKASLSTPDKLLRVSQALRSIDNLQEFRWLTGWSSISPEEMEKQLFAEFTLWGAVSQQPTLRRLEVLDMWSDSHPPTGFQSEFNYDTDYYPLWSISNLSALKLRNVNFLRQQNCLHQFSGVLRRSPSLESLCLYASNDSFDLPTLLRGCQFSNLRELRVEVSSWSTSTHREAFACLLEQTPTLEDVTWEFNHAVRPLQARSLPALKQLSAWQSSESHAFGFDLLVDESLPPRKLETIAGFRLTPSSLVKFGRVNRNALRKLELSKFHNIELVVQVANMFPSLTWLAIPSTDYTRDYWRVTKEPVHQ
ncbi:hypothetical protein BV25DRAFT_1525903 [Artomyces pyxidatus]|uniref:Uncharacterized protein n=1 Tax=Artomyces pyxidatus TaxID=48021 RepID=A0ACB8TCX7_9AGAM|nr:hypothetical protein BV25DRAFT_1525903 [Artomyces pyxidatus]